MPWDIANYSKSTYDYCDPFVSLIRLLAYEVPSSLTLWIYSLLLLDFVLDPDLMESIPDFVTALFRWELILAPFIFDISPRIGLKLPAGNPPVKC